jgi:hypothetical protein
MRKLALLTALAVAVVLTLVVSPREAKADHICGATGSSAGRYHFTTWESGAYWIDYPNAMTLAANRQLTVNPAFLWTLEEGSRAYRWVEPSALIPPTLLKAIAYVETEKYAQADYSVPYGVVGATLVSHDCGYGLMQITTGMQNTTGVPDHKQTMIGTHYALNIAEGARILADKWNAGPESRPLVGNSDSSLLESWYFAVWGYNGFVFNNHPYNPDRPPPEVRYLYGEPYWDCRTGAGIRSDYPYQELVYGCVAKGVSINGNFTFAGQPVSMPNLWDKKVAASMDVDHWSGAFLKPSSVAAMDIDTPLPAHFDAAGPSGVTGEQVFGWPWMTVDSTAPLAFSLNAPAPSRPITISNTGNRVSTFRIVPSSSWIRVSLDGGAATGADLGGQPSTFTVSIDASQLPGDHYEGSILLESEVGGGGPITIPVIASRDTSGALFEGWNTVDYNGLEVPWWEVTNTLNSMVNPEWAWAVAARLDGGRWLTHFKNAPLPTFNTLPNLLPGVRHWLFVTSDAVFGTP